MKVSLKSAQSRAKGLYTTISGLRGRVWDLVVDIVDSWESWDYNSNAVDMLCKGLRADKKTSGWVYIINQHLKKHTNLMLHLKKDTGYIGLIKPKEEKVKIKEGFYTNPLTAEAEKKETQKKPVEERVKKYLETALKELSKDDIKRILDSIA